MVREADTKGRGLEVEVHRIKSLEPDYDDPVYLAKLEKFLIVAVRQGLGGLQHHLGTGRDDKARQEFSEGMV